MLKGGWLGGAKYAPEDPEEDPDELPYTEAPELLTSADAVTEEDCKEVLTPAETLMVMFCAAAADTLDFRVPTR